MLPEWLYLLAVVSLLLAGVCSLVIVFDIFNGHRQQMWIMEVVWPVTALYAGPLALYAYFKLGRLATRKKFQGARKNEETPPSMKKPFWQSVGLGASHCGGGCTLGDIIAEWFIFTVPFFLFGRKLFAGWVIDYILAYIFGIAFQYFTIAPMRNLSLKEGLIAAVKADTLSLTAWQVGMYGWMAISTFLIFGQELPQNSPIFWFMMQIAMLLGFLTAYPVNWWLIRRGIKEKM